MRAKWKAAKVWVYHDEVCEEFHHALDDFMIVGFGEPFQRRLFDYVAEVWCQSEAYHHLLKRNGRCTNVVFTVFRLPKLINEELYAVW